MKVKALRKKNEPKEFVHIDYNNETNSFNKFTSNIPKIYPQTATIEELLKYYFDTFNIKVDLIDYEFVEFDLIDSGVIGADIRNKLTPSLNLVAMLKLYFKETDNKKKKELKKFIEKDMKKSEKNIKYIANLL